MSVVCCVKYLPQGGKSKAIGIKRKFICNFAVLNAILLEKGNIIEEEERQQVDESEVDGVLTLEICKLTFAENYSIVECE